MNDDKPTFNERKSPDLQRELEQAARDRVKKDWLNRFLRAIGKYFGLE